MMTPVERFDFLVENLAGGSQKKFADKVGMTTSCASRLHVGKAELCYFMERIYKAYPEINAAWLLTGEGEPFLSPKKTIRDSLMRRLEQIEQRLKKLEGGCDM